MATEIENVLAQFALLEPKEQQKFMASATAHLQGQPKKAKKAKKASDDDEEKPKRELSGNQIKWNALVKTCREIILSSTGLEKLPQKVVMCVAGKLKELDNFEPSEEEVTEAYENYVANPTLSKTAEKRAAAGSDTGSVASAKEVKAVEIKAAKPKAAEKATPPAKAEPKAAPPKAEPKAAKPKAEEKPKAAESAKKAEKAAEKPKAEEKPKAAEKPKAKEVKKVAPPPPADDEEEVIETEKWKHDGKDYARSKTAPFYCWDLKTQEYKGVWDPEKKEFDLSVADPYNDAESCVE